MPNAMHSTTSSDRRRPLWMLLAIATNVAPLALAALLSSPLEPQVVALLEGIHDPLFQRVQDDFLSGLPEGAAYYLTVHAVYFLVPFLPFLLLLRFTRLRFGLALNRLTLVLLVSGATGFVLRMSGGIYYHMASGRMHLTKFLGGALDALILTAMLAGISALVLSTVWYRWVRPRPNWVRVLQRLWAPL